MTAFWYYVHNHSGCGTATVLLYYYGTLVRTPIHRRSSASNLSAFIRLYFIGGDVFNTTAGYKGMKFFQISSSQFLPTAMPHSGCNRQPDQRPTILVEQIRYKLTREVDTWMRSLSITLSHSCF